MTKEDFAHAQYVLRGLRVSLDSRLDRVVRSAVQGEDVDKSLFVTASSDQPSFVADRYWPEAGWPDQLKERQ